MPERATENVPLQKFNGRLVSPPDITPPPAYEPCPSLQPTRGAEERASVELYTRYKCRSSPNMPILERTTLRRKRTDKTSEVQDSDADENDSDHEDEQPVRTKPRTLLSTRCTVAREVTKPRTALTAKRTPLPRLTKIKKGDINNTITEGTEPDEEEVEAAGIEGSDTEKDSPEDEVNHAATIIFPSPANGPSGASRSRYNA